MPQRSNYWTRRWKRRRLMQASAVTGLGGAALWTVGCGGDDDDDGGDTTPGGEPTSAGEPTAASDEPKRGGKLNLVWGVEDSHLDPHTSSEHFSAELWRTAGNGLLRQEELTHFPQADLAESWEQPDDLTITFRLSPGITWHDLPPVDGRAFTAEDAVYSLERMATPEPDYRRSSSFALVESFSAPDESTVQVKLSQPYVPILSAISNKWSVMVAPEVVEQFGDLKSGDSIIGTGPFISQEANSSIGATLVRNPNYFKSGLPYLDEVEYTTITDPASRDSAFRAGQFDIHLVVEPDLPMWESDDSLRIETFEGTVFHLSIIAGKVDEPPLDNPQVRKALDLAIDRDDLARAAWPGSSYRKAAVFPNLTWGIQPEEVETLPGFRSPKDEDRAEARRLLEAAGYGDGLTLTVNTTNAYPQYHITRAEALLPQFQEIGVNLEINLLEFGALKEAEVNKNFEYNLATYAYFDDPDFPLYNSLHSQGVRNYWNWSDPEYDDIVDRQRAASDEEERKQLVLDAQRYLLEAVPVSFDEWFIPQYVAIRTFIKGFKTGDFPGGGNGTFLAETWLDT